MADLINSANGIRLTLRPYHISDDSGPVWITTQLELVKDGKTRLSDTISMTLDDFASLIASLRELDRSASPVAEMCSTDGDFAFHASAVDPGQGVLVGFWIGEPHDLAEGYRFVVDQDDLKEFATKVESELRTISKSASIS